jgi:hypothetical protein
MRKRKLPKRFVVKTAEREFVVYGPNRRTAEELVRSRVDLTRAENKVPFEVSEQALTPGKILLDQRRAPDS